MSAQKLYPQSLDSFRFSTRCLTGGLAAAPLHHIDAYGCSSRNRSDAGAIARASLLGSGASGLDACVFMAARERGVGMVALIATGSLTRTILRAAVGVARRLLTLQRKLSSAAAHVENVAEAA